LVLHAWWGLNDFFRDFCDRLARAGFVALAPDMFSGKVVRTIDEAKQHLSQFNEEQDVPLIVLSAVEDLSKNPAVTGNRLGIVGFSMGAYWALWLAQQKPELIGAVTLFYGTNGGDGGFQDSTAAFLGHFAESDEFEPPANVDNLEESLRRAGRPVTFYRYPGTGHWFFEQDVSRAYNPAAASLAWERTLAFLKRV
jgi:carboxymethylenebutenolidase